MAAHSSTLAWGIPWKGGAWQATVHGVAKSRTRLSDFTFTFFMTGVYGGSDGKASAYNAGVLSQIPGLGRSPGEGDGIPVFLPGESHGQRNLVGYNPQGCKESDMTERLTLSLSYSQLIHTVVEQKLT